MRVMSSSGTYSVLEIKQLESLGSFVDVFLFF